MKTRRRVALLPILLLVLPTVAVQADETAAGPRPIPGTKIERVAAINPAIDMEGYLRVSRAAALHRESRRLSEEEFLRVARRPGTIVLDARSKERFDELHVKGAIHLSFPDIAVASLAEILPDKNATILIYCNNNFRDNNPVTNRAMMSKLPSASLNLSTYIALYNYGYRNVYELAPLLDTKTTKLEFEGTLASAAQ
jgi:hypothetical protein